MPLGKSYFPLREVGKNAYIQTSIVNCAAFNKYKVLQKNWISINREFLIAFFLVLQDYQTTTKFPDISLTQPVFPT